MRIEQRSVTGPGWGRLTPSIFLVRQADSFPHWGHGFARESAAEGQTCTFSQEISVLRQRLFILPAVHRPVRHN